MRPALAVMVALVVAGCMPVNCHGQTLEEELPRPLVPYDVVSPCVYRYHDEPSKPGFPHPEVDGISYPAFKVSTREHLVTFTSCDSDAGISGKVELRYVYTGAPPAF